MYKRIISVLSILLVGCFFLSGCGSESGAYKDGVFEGKSALTSESYYGVAKITIKGGQMKTIDFQIFDGSGKVLDKDYGPTVFAGNATYQDQCTNELKGMKQYNEKLLSGQDIDKVDTISGATWSGKIFKETVQNTLETAKKN